VVLIVVPSFCRLVAVSVPRVAAADQWILVFVCLGCCVAGFAWVSWAGKKSTIRRIVGRTD
jgi:hypothetical protein